MKKDPHPLNRMIVNIHLSAQRNILVYRVDRGAVCFDSSDGFNYDDPIQQKNFIAAASFAVDRLGAPQQQQTLRSHVGRSDDVCSERREVPGEISDARTHQKYTGSPWNSTIVTPDGESIQILSKSQRKNRNRKSNKMTGYLNHDPTEMY